MRCCRLNTGLLLPPVITVNPALRSSLLVVTNQPDQCMPKKKNHHANGEVKGVGQSQTEEHAQGKKEMKCNEKQRKKRGRERGEGGGQNTTTRLLSRIEIGDR